MKYFIKFCSMIFAICFVCILSGCTLKDTSATSSDSSSIKHYSENSAYAAQDSIADETQVNIAEQFLQLYIRTNRDVSQQQEVYKNLATSACLDALYAKFDRPAEAASTQTVSMSIAQQSTFVKPLDEVTAQVLSLIYVRSNISLPTGTISNNEPYLIKLKLIKADTWKVDELTCEVSLYEVSDLPIQDLLD